MSELDVVRGFRGMRVLLLGDAMLDTYLEGEAVRLCREGPVPVIRSSSEDNVPGGAANTASNLAALGAEVFYLGIVGADESGCKLRGALRERGVDDAHLIEVPSCSTLQKLRVVANGQYVVRYDSGQAAAMSSDALLEYLARLERLYERCDVVIVSDYGYGAVPDEVIERLNVIRARGAHETLGHTGPSYGTYAGSRGTQSGTKPLIVDAKNLLRFAHSGASLVTPNQAEACAAAGVNDGAGDRPVSLLEVEHIGRRLLQRVDAERAAITLASDGVLLCDRQASVHIPARAVEQPYDVGAGDSFTAATALALGRGASAETAVRIGVEAALVAVTKERTAVVPYQELLRRFSRGEERPTESVESLAAEVVRYKRSGHKVVFTNGVFDILQAGHVHFLRQARKLGDVLIVGVNSDDSARRVRGKNRLINGERERLELVAALDPVDHVVAFDEDSPAELIRQLRPDVHVKGGDYADASLPEAQAVSEVGGEVVILPFGEERGTSEVIERIVTLVTA